MIDLKKIRRLVRLLETSNLGLIEWAEGKEKIRLVKRNTNKIIVSQSGREAETDNSPALTEATAVAGTENLPPNIKIQKSGMIGTLYVAPAHDAEAFIHIGDQIKKGQTLCIIESIGIRNEIKSEYDGEIVEVFVVNIQAVEYDQPLFAIKEIEPNRK